LKGNIYLSYRFTGYPAYHVSHNSWLNLLFATALLGCCITVQAQSLSLPQNRPSEQPLEIPPLEEETAPAPLVLPPLPKPAPEDRLSGQLRIHINRIRLEGNAVFTTEELSELTREYEGRLVTADDLQELRYRLTLYYITHGYINSGAVIPDQSVEDGDVTIRIIEGELSEILVSGNTRLRPRYLTSRIERDAGPPLNVNRLGERLQILQQDPRIERLNASLAPGSRPGESILDVSVKEARPYQLWLGGDNHQPPSVGGNEVVLGGFHQNVSGHGDTLQFEYDYADGLDDWYTTYTLPLNAYDTAVQFYVSRTDSEVVESPFDVLDIESKGKTYGLSLLQPVWQTPQQTLTLGLTLNLRQSETFLLGEPFAFTPGTDNGKTDLTILRFSQEWQKRGRMQVFAARSLFSSGIDALGATVNNEPQDGKFFYWLGQFQWARRLADTSTQVIVRASTQLTSDGLPSMERFTVGGFNTVRGYRENRLVTDQGFVGSIEFRIPIYYNPAQQLQFQLAPFADYGYASNQTGLDPDKGSISSVGLGLLGSFRERVNLNVYYGYPFRKFDDANDNIQDKGWHFSLSARLL